MSNINLQKSLYVFILSPFICIMDMLSYLLHESTKIIICLFNNDIFLYVQRLYTNEHISWICYQVSYMNLQKSSYATCMQCMNLKKWSYVLYIYCHHVLRILDMLLYLIHESTYIIYVFNRFDFVGPT